MRLFLILSLIFLSAPSASNIAVAKIGSPVGEVDEAVANVFGKNPNNRLKPGDTIHFKESIRTGWESAISIRFLDDTQLHLGPKSNLLIDEFIFDPDAENTNGLLKVTQGTFRFISGIVAGERNLSIETPQATIGIRGTIFDVKINRKMTEINMHEGQVEIITKEGTTNIVRGQSATVNKKGEVKLNEKTLPELSETISKIHKLLGLSVSTNRAGEEITKSLRPIVLNSQEFAQKEDQESTNIEVSYNPENTLLLEIEKGTVIIEMLPKIAPAHVRRIKTLVRRKFYDGLIFHNVVAGFAAETGDPTGRGDGGSGVKLKAELSNYPFGRGAVGMKHLKNDLDSADSQFFIIFGRARHLDGKYTAWGQVRSGMELLERLIPGNPPMPSEKIIKLRVAADLNKN